MSFVGSKIKDFDEISKSLDFDIVHQHTTNFVKLNVS